MIFSVCRKLVAFFYFFSPAQLAYGYYQIARDTIITEIKMTERSKQVSMKAYEYMTSVLTLRLPVTMTGLLAPALRARILLLGWRPDAIALEVYCYTTTVYRIE